MNNYWDPFEYNKLKLLLNPGKVESILKVSKGEKQYDDLFPISIDLHLTTACNLKCSWCTDQLLMKKVSTMATEKAYSLLDEFAAHNTGVTLEGGGEPTLHPHFSEIVDYAFNKGICLGLITNGVRNIDKDIYKFRWVRVSLDSCNEKQYLQEKGKNYFSEVLKNLSNFSKARNPQKTFLGVGYVITKRNMEYLEKLIDELDEIGVDYIYFRPVEEAEDILPSVEEMLNLKKDLLNWTEGKRIKHLINIYDRVVKNNNHLPCVAHSLTSIIHADGTVNLCEKRRHDEICLGNVNETSFEELWNSDIRRLASNKLLCADCQNGCDVCRVTGFNDVFYRLQNINTSQFI
ncbi:radical SAM protein [Butyrivibrio sp. YAB3001]|uniref:radical SAM protein n=1 Tax=Butyrivibrio sp. YAB3001 TaxID=1520812 RepID=UPI0008F67EC7|nr:radical SAM protein [Butyrivibrio sp. YAB3001]SFC94316.1 radical SAM additional 4Fe4S-binding SPASM domain-containing protein [Butyrivibrio sp. YAB3001]